MAILMMEFQDSAMNYEDDLWNLKVIFGLSRTIL